MRTLLEGVEWRVLEDHRFGLPGVGALRIVNPEGAGVILDSAEEAEWLVGALLSWAARARVAEGRVPEDERPKMEARARAISPDALYDVDQVAAMLSPPGRDPFHRDTVYRMGKRGVLPPVRIGPKRGRVRWRGSTILEYLEESQGRW